jgi:2-methylcitrate dehydratase PrpD
MTAVSQLADLVSSIKYTSLPSETVDHTKMHILDSIGAMLAGIHSREGRAVKSLVYGLMAANGLQNGSKYELPTLPSIISSCSAARCTEFDDIHLESCTTPGSIVVPTAISLAKAGYFSDTKEFIMAVVVGYDVLIRFGLAINGPAVLQKGIWPTYFSAPVGSTAVAARALKLNQKQAVNALSTGFAFSSGTVIHPHGELTSRWLTIGLAAQNGVIAAFAAQNGFTGSDSLVAESSGQYHGLPFYTAKLTDKLGGYFMIDETGMKPYPVARQGLAAVEAFREIINSKKISMQSIDNIKVMVPELVIGIIDRPNLTGNRLDAISSLQYQIALAAINPEALLDPKREHVIRDDSILSLMRKVNVIGNAELSSYYPATWPARVEVAYSGQVFTHEMLYPPGDYRNRLGWDKVINKFRKAADTTLKQPAIDEIITLIQDLDTRNDLPRLGELMGE